MNFKSQVPVLLAALLSGMLFCNRDPVNVDFKTAPIADPQFPRYDFGIMFADSSGDYFGVQGNSGSYWSCYNTFKVSPDSYTPAGGRVVPIDTAPFSIDRLYIDSLNRISMVCFDGNYSLGPDLRWSRNYAFSPGGQLYGDPVSVDWDRNCYCFRQPGLEYYEIYRYTPYQEKLCVSGFFPPGFSHYPVFAAAAARFAVIVRDTTSETRCLLFQDNVLTRTVALFSDSDGVFVTSAFFLDDQMYICFYTYSDLYPTGNSQWPPIARTRHYGVAIIDSSGKLYPAPIDRFGDFELTSLQIVYRSRSEAWLQNTTGYLFATPDTLIWRDFRTSASVNRFDALCFNDTGEVLLFDEATERFIPAPR